MPFDIDNTLGSYQILAVHQHKDIIFYILTIYQNENFEMKQ